MMDFKVWLDLSREDISDCHPPTLDISCDYCTDGEELNDEGANIIVKITDPSRKDQYGNPWKDRLAFAMSIDFDWN